MIGDVAGFYGAIGITLPATTGANVAVACFADPGAHRHDDKNKSASIATDNGAWRCHGCGAAGGPYDAALALGRTTREAMELLERHALVKEGRTPDRQPPRRPTVQEGDVGRFHTALLDSREAVERLAQLRGWSADIIRRFGVGLDASYSNPRGGGPIVIPSRDELGALTGAVHYQPNPARRAEGSSKSWASGPRQLFPAPETIEGDAVWLVEGESDALAAWSAGLPAVGVPGVQGWKQAWSSRFARFARIVVCPDADQPGRELAAKLIPDLAPIAEVRHLDLADLADGRDGFDISDAVLEARENGGVNHLRELLEGWAAGIEPERPAVVDTAQTATDGSAGDGRHLTLITTSDVTPEAVRWAWEDRIPLGALSIIAGLPGLGKSTTTIHIAAQVSRGTLDGSLFGEPSDVLLVTLEDHLASVVRGRLEVAGADLTRVHVVTVKDTGSDALVTLPDDLHAIEAAARDLNARLLVVDPLVAAVSAAIDSHKDQSVRRALAPLAQYAERANVAVVGIMHMTKAEADGLLNRVAGSVAWGGAARSVFAFARDPDDEDGEAGYGRLLVHAKSNWGRYARTLQCRIDTGTIETQDGPSEQSKLTVLGECDLTGADLAGNRDPGELGEAIEFLEAYLGDGGWHPQREIKRAAEQAWRTVQRAAQRLDIEYEKRGFPAVSMWRLPVAPSPSGATGEAASWRNCENGSVEPDSGSPASSRAKHPGVGATGENGPRLDEPATPEQEALAERLRAASEDW